MLPFEPNINTLIRYIDFNRRFSNKYGEIYPLFSWHSHSELELIRLNSGRLTVELRNRRYELMPGDIIVFNCFEEHYGYSYIQYQSIQYDVIQINFDHFGRTARLEVDQFIEQLHQGKLLLYHYLNKELAERSGIAAHMERLKKYLLHKPPLQELALTGETNLLLFDLMQNGLYHRSLPVYGQNERFVQEVSQYLEEHFAEDLTTASVALHFNYNKSYFCRLFREKFGITFSRHLRHLRIYKLMSSPNFDKLSWEELAYQVGFHNYQYFYQAFIEQFGVSPTKNRDSFFANVGNQAPAAKGKK